MIIVVKVRNTIKLLENKCIMTELGLPQAFKDQLTLEKSINDFCLLADKSYSMSRKFNTH